MLVVGIIILDGANIIFLVKYEFFVLKILNYFLMLLLEVLLIIVLLINSLHHLLSIDISCAWSVIALHYLVLLVNYLIF